MEEDNLSNLFKKDQFDNKFTLSKIKKMILFYNAIENGWKVQKKEESYIFSKKHNNKQEYFDKEYIETFLSKYMEESDIKHRIKDILIN